MARKTSPRGSWYLILIGFITTVLVAGLISMQPPGSPLNWFIRGTALLGYLAVFLTLVSSAYMRQVYRLFGRPFLKVHHILSIAGLILLTFTLASVHALQIGTDLQRLGTRVLVAILMLIATITFIQKRLQHRRRGFRTPNS